jgi:hypothetical protein
VPSGATSLALASQPAEVNEIDGNGIARALAFAESPYDPVTYLDFHPRGDSCAL